MSQDPYDQSQDRSHRQQEPRSFPAFGGEIAGGHQTPTDQTSRESGQGSAWNREPEGTDRGQSQSNQGGGLHRGALGSEEGTESQNRGRSRGDVDRQGRRHSSTSGGGKHRTTDHRSQEQLQGPPSVRREGRPGQSQREEHAPGRGVGDAGDRPPGHERGRFQEGRGGMANNPPRSPDQRSDRDVHGQGRVQQDQTRTAGRSEREQQSHGGPRSHGQHQGQPTEGGPRGQGVSQEIGNQGQPHGGSQSSWQPWKQRSEPPEGSQFSSQGGTRSGSEGVGRGRSQRQGQHGQHEQHGQGGHHGQQGHRGGGQQRSQHAGQQRSQGTGRQQRQGGGQQQRQGGSRQQRQRGSRNAGAGGNQRGTRQQQSGGQQGGQPDEGLLYGGQAQHGHESSHVGAEQTFGEPMEQSQQGRTESNLPHQWQEQRQTYPDSYGGGEAYDYQHRHGNDQGDWPLGAPPAEGRR